MGKTSRKRQALSQAEKPTGEQAGKLSSRQAGEPASVKAAFIYRPVFHVLLICVLGFLAYSNTFRSPFQWDEAEYILRNPIIKNLAYFMEPSRAETLIDNALISRYIGYLTFALNYRVHGFDVTGYHIVNLAIHIINAILVYFLVVLTFRTPYFRSEESGVRSEESGSNPPQSPLKLRGDKGGLSTPHHSRLTPHTSHFIALAVALLFVSHPVQTEAVTYVFQRFASLVAVFYLLSLVLYVKGRIRQAERQVKAKVKVKVKVKVKEETDTSTSVSASTAFLPSSAYTFACFFLSFVFAVLAMKTKENAFTLPLIITLYEFLFFTGPVKTRLLRLVPFFLTMLIIPATLAGLSNTAAEVISQVKDPLSLGYEKISRESYFFTQLRVIVTYMRLLFLPINQNIDYDYPLYHSLFDLPVLLSFLFLSAIFGGAAYLLFKVKKWEVRSGKSEPGSGKWEVGSEKSEPGSGKWEVGSEKSGTSYFLLPTSYFRLVSFGILWFFITLSVESSIIPIPMVIAEYRLYLPSVGFFLAVVSGAMLLLQKFTEKSIGRSPSPSRGRESVDTKSSPPILGGVSEGQGGKWNEVLLPDKPPQPLLNQGGELDRQFARHASRVTAFAAAALAVVILALASATYARNTLWKDKVTLWEDVVRKSPDSPRGYNNLGIAYNEKGLHEKAIDMYERVLALLPSYRNARVNMGIAYASTGRVDRAIAEFTQAIALDPKNSVPYFNLALAYFAAGKPDKAAENYIKSVELNPYDSKVYHGLGTAYLKLGRPDDALAAYTKFVSLSPNDPEAYRNRGIAYAETGDFGKAGADFRKACSLGSRESCNYLQDPRFR